MSTVHFCDGCGEQAKRIYDVGFPVHIVKNDVLLGHSDSEGNPTSGRFVSVELCRKCSNSVYGAAFHRLLDIRKIAEKKTKLAPLPD